MMSPPQLGCPWNLTPVETGVTADLTWRPVGTPRTHNTLERLVERPRADTVMYRSDISLFDACRQAGRIATAEVPNGDERKMLGLNATCYSTWTTELEA